MNFTQTEKATASNHINHRESSRKVASLGENVSENPSTNFFETKRKLANIPSKSLIGYYFSADFAIKIRQSFSWIFNELRLERVERKCSKDKRRKSFNWIFPSRCVCWFELCKNLIKRSILAAPLFFWVKTHEKKGIKDQKNGKNENSPSLHLKCASSRASPASLGWGTMRYNESMRGQNHWICCCLSCSVSYLKNAHRCRETYLTRAMMMMWVKRCRTRGLVLVLDDSRCVHRGMIALKVTLRRFFTFLPPSDFLFKSGDDNDVFRLAKPTQVMTMKNRFSWLLFLLLFIFPPNELQLMKWKFNLRAACEEEK